MSNREWFVVTVEHDESGIRGENYVQAVWPPLTAEDAGLAPGFSVVGVRTWLPNTHFPKLPNYVGRPCY